MKFLLIFIACVGLNAQLLGEFELKKDELKNFEIIFSNPSFIQKTLNFRWTLSKDGVLIVLANYDRIPHQFAPNSQLNALKITLSNINGIYAPNPHMIFYFIDFDMARSVARFRYYLFDSNGNIEVNEWN